MTSESELGHSHLSPSKDKIGKPKMEMGGETECPNSVHERLQSWINSTDAQEQLAIVDDESETEDPPHDVDLTAEEDEFAEYLTSNLKPPGKATEAQAPLVDDLLADEDDEFAEYLTSNLKPPGKTTVECKTTEDPHLVNDLADEEVEFAKYSTSNFQPQMETAPECPKTLDPPNFEADFQAKEDELEEYLTYTRKPRKKTLAELLKALPNYQQILSSKPCIKFDKQIIDLTGVERKKVNVGVKALMDRFMKHTAVVKKPKEQRFTLHLSKKEEDSQGNQKPGIDEVNYVEQVSDDEDDSGSPGRSKSGSKLVRFQERLRAKILANKAKEYEEKRKLYAMYNEEKELKDKDGEEEELEEDFSTESEPELTDEEAEKIRRKKKKKKLKSAFVDDEAEDSEEGANNDENDEDDEKSQSKQTDSEDEIKIESDTDDVIMEKTYRRVRKVFDDSSDDEEAVEGKVNLDNLPTTTQTLLKSKEREDAIESDELPMDIDAKKSEASSKSPDRNSPLDDLFADDDEADPRESEIVDTPCKTVFVTQSAETQITPAQREIMNLVDSESPSFTSPVKDSPRNSWMLPVIMKNGRVSGKPMSAVSPFMSRLDSDAALDAFEEDMEYTANGTPCAPVSKEIARLFDEPSNGSPKYEDLMALCSGKFPSQAPVTPAETQCSGFDSQSQSQQQTPSSTTAPITARRESQNETPRLNDKERVHKTRLFMEDDPLEEKEEGITSGKILSDDEDEDEIIAKRRAPQKNKRRLEFSDDEDAGSAVESPDVSDAEGDGSGKEYDYDSEENEVLKEKKPEAKVKGIVGRSGYIRREFVENEAELSGSEEGSGDEDERGLDILDEEAGDDEEIDEDEVRDELGRAHLKNLLDDDQRNIRLLQQQFLEDGDLHGEGSERQRQFKWKNIDSLIEEGNNGPMNDVIAEEEDEAERHWIEQKAEKDKWMKENSHLLEPRDEDDEEDSQKIFLEDSQFFRLGKSTLKKIQSSCSFYESTSSNSCSQSAKSGNVKALDKPSSSKEFNSQGSGISVRPSKLTSQAAFASPDDPILKIKRGSFLSRGIPSLTRLAEMTKGCDPNSKNLKNNSRNFVFAVVTPPGPNDSGDSQGVRFKGKKNQKMTQPKKMPRIDRSFDSLDSTSKGASIFTHY